MAATGDTLTMPDGTAFRIAKSAQDTRGEVVEIEITLPAGAPSPPRHFHPEQDEAWSVLEGTLSVYLDGRWRSLDAGESISTPRGHHHTLRNRSGETVRVLDVHRPALDFQDYIEKLHQLAQSGKIKSPRHPKSLIYFALLWREQETQVAASPVLRGGISLLALLGKLLGYRAT